MTAVASLPIGLLRARLRALADAVGALRTHVVEDLPDEVEFHGDHRSITALVQAVTDVADQVDLAVVALDRGAGETGVAAACGALVPAGRLLRDELLAFDGRFADVRRATRRWAPAWRAWADVVRAALLDLTDAFAATESAVVLIVSARLDPDLDLGLDPEEEQP